MDMYDDEKKEDELEGPEFPFDDEEELDDDDELDGFSEVEEDGAVEEDDELPY